ncbi:MAG TPA: TIGR00159 family protein [Lachnospiraceae bacterium]|nr:diadenylate cyclase CdaA [Lachnospiraceae bacterium]MBQ2454446.1 diadenylate cyclase CdaA [Lachnospiraceae bacterium]MBQ4242921.1 diadenylate cyclase CdaA [Lachnospiraceae bacterium]MBQ5534054.1 diadenylate cyclase CdaA [Lachnospiraceae bacterium]MBQ9566900.1 diadenylate cyclase CdaA [Lachnospiraceae bacterium]
MQQFIEQVKNFISFDSIPTMGITDYLEILIIAFLVYEVMLWLRDTRAWSLMRGIVVIVVFVLVAYLLQMTTILWIVRNGISVILMALLISFQPEIRRALDSLGRKNFIASLFAFNSSSVNERFSDKTINEIVKACYEMGRARTGALIVMKQNDPLTEYVRTGIEVDAIVTNQLLINIFEHNTPLHDGAVIVEGDRVVSATCYLPLSDNMELSKELGTRHRAGVGISEATDSLTIIVSEETGRVSIAYGGSLMRSVDQDKLREELVKLQNKIVTDDRRSLIRGRSKV